MMPAAQPLLLNDMGSRQISSEGEESVFGDDAGMTAIESAKMLMQ